MKPIDTEFIKKAMDLEWIAPRQASRFILEYQTQMDRFENIAAFLVANSILSAEQAKQLFNMVQSTARQKVGEYEILAKLGEGAMGTVYKAQGPLGVVAVKVIAAQCSEKPEYVQRFIREAQVASRLNHRNIVRTLDFGVEIKQDLLFAIQEFVEGKSVDYYISARGGKLGVREALNVVAQVAQGLHFAQQAKVVHRDIKPDNLLIDQKGVVKIADFGLVKDTSYESITQTGTILGTPAYMSPEQARGEGDLDIRSDVYSLGIVFFEMLTGKVPFDDPSVLKVLMMHNRNPMPPVAGLTDPQTALVAQPILDGMTAKDKNNRFTPIQLLRTLQKIKF